MVVHRALGTVEYREALTLQHELRAQRQADEVADTLLTLDHPPVYTRGRRTGPQELPMGEAWYRSQGIDVVDVDRGGKVTYHGPGQLVGYFIVRTTDVVGLVRTIKSGASSRPWSSSASPPGPGPTTGRT